MAEIGAPEPVPTGIMVDGVDAGGKPVTVYSTTGDKRTEEDFTAALARYNATGTAPQGYTVLQPGVMNTLRSGFEAVNQPVQRALPAIGGAVGHAVVNPPGLTTALQGLGLLSPEAAQTIETAARGPGRTIGAGVGGLIGSQVNTPEKLAMTAATAAVAPYLPLASVARLGAAAVPEAVAGVAGAAAPAVRGALSIANILKAGGLAGGVGAGASAVAGTATGTMPTLGRAAAEFGIAAAGGSFNSVLGHFMTTYVHPDQQEAALGGIVDTMKARYPHLADDPHLMDMAVSSKEKLASMTQQMSGPLRESYDAVSSTMIQDINAIAPQALSVGQQATLRAKMRTLDRAATRYLDTILERAPGTSGAPSVNQHALAALGAAKTDVIDFVSDAFPMARSNAAIVGGVTQTLQRQMGALAQYEEGAQVLGWLQRSGAAKGFDPMTFARTIQGEYQAQPGSLLHQTGQLLGGGVRQPGGASTGGRALTEMPAAGAAGGTPPTGPTPFNLMDFGKTFLPHPWQYLTRNISRAAAAPPGAAPLTPWPTVAPSVVGPNPATSIAVQQAGQDAMRAFVHRRETQP